MRMHYRSENFTNFTFPHGKFVACGILRWKQYIEKQKKQSIAHLCEEMTPVGYKCNKYLDSHP